MVAHGLTVAPSNELPRGRKVAIVHTRWNDRIVKSLVDKATSTLKNFGTDVDIHVVPGSFELPLAAKSLAVSFQYDAIIAIGVLIEGETMHFEYIAQAVSDGLMKVQIETMCPVIFGVLTCLNEEQAEARAGLRGGHNHGEDWAYAALEMIKYKS